MFELKKTTPLGRRGRLEFTRGAIETPFFMPVGTAGAMKGLTHDDLHELGAQILLCNTYHLLLQPGDELVRDAGGLHDFIGWEKPILTDSGGYQVYSLRKTNKVTDEGVHFQSHINGDKYFIGPKESMQIQHNLGSDMIMVFDECPPSTASRADIQKAVDRTLKWAAVCKQEHARLKGDRDCKLFGIVQGGLERDLREKCAEELIAIGFDGYAIGGLAVGEQSDDMFPVIEAVCPLLPEDKPRYLMGVGDVAQMKQAITLGIDMFDSVLPMRIARHGTILLSDETSLRIQNVRHKTDHSVIDANSPSAFSRTHKKSYLHHLLKANERLADTLSGMQNIGVTLKAMQDLREEMEKVIS